MFIVDILIFLAVLCLIGAALVGVLLGALTMRFHYNRQVRRQIQQLRRESRL